MSTETPWENDDDRDKNFWPYCTDTTNQKLAPPINWHLACQRLRRKTDAQSKEKS